MLRIPGCSEFKIQIPLMTCSLRRFDQLIGRVLELLTCVGGWWMVHRTPVPVSPFKHLTSCRAWNMSSPVVISSHSRKVGSESSSVATDTRLLSPPVTKLLVSSCQQITDVSIICISDNSI